MSTTYFTIVRVIQLKYALYIEIGENQNFICDS